MYFDANNLYGWAMSQPLPMGEFDWLTDQEIAELDRDVPDHGGEHIFQAYFPTHI
jgi:hypothetical protein